MLALCLTWVLRRVHECPGTGSAFDSWLALVFVCADCFAGATSGPAGWSTRFS